MTGYRAFRIHEEDGIHRAGIETLPLAPLAPGEVQIRVRYSSVNYKDALAGTGKGRILRRFPLTGGIDAAGKVAASRDDRFREGDAVLVTGYELSQTHDGGYAEYLTVPADWVVPLPEGLSLFDAMAIGTAGFTAALALHRLELNGQRPDKGPLLITGASGGVGSLAVDIFSGQGYAVTAMTGKADQYDTLRRLGASEIIGREDLPMGERPLEKGIWGGAVDNVGGATLAAITRTVRPWGSIAAIGMAGGIKLHTTVMPFIIRGVSLLGINSAGCPGSLRGELWQRLATDLRPLHLEVIVDQTVTLDDLPWVFDKMLRGETHGRILVNIQGNK
ncbi:MAG TPA: oxidoreductase [Chromatiales bacterium]|nr:oxidoreductase [Chromatiales bacterium]